jgi:hypothetical protein
MTRRALCIPSISPQVPSTCKNGAPSAAAVIIPGIHTLYYYD